MQIRDKNIKLLFVAFAVSLLIVFLPLNASAQTSVKLASEGSAVSNLNKYLQHVNVTQYGWYSDAYNASNVQFNPYVTGPDTNHVLWIAHARPYEALGENQPIVVDGVFITSISSGQSIYGPSGSGSASGSMLYAFDENTGNIIWVYPGLTSGIVIDNQHFLSGTTMLDPSTGKFLYTTSTSISLYVPDLKIGFSSRKQVTAMTSPTQRSQNSGPQANTNKWEP